MRSPLRRAGATAVLAVLSMTGMVAGCSSGPEDASTPAGASGTARASSTTPAANPSQGASTASGASSTSGAKATAGATVPATVRLAFAGDTMAEGDSARVLDAGLGKVGQVLAKADVAVVNVETVLADDTSGLQRQPKAYNFLAPTRLLDVLAHSGVDAVTVANNHGMDYGRTGLERTLAAGSKNRPEIIGAGRDITQALAPWRTQVRGRGVTVFAASDVLDTGFDWAAGPHRSGLALTKTAQEYAALRAAVRDARAQHPTDVIAVYLHAGVELHVCATDRQQQLARDLASDGASAVIMSHAHLQQPATTIGDTAVDYGMGNFVFYAHTPVTRETGVLEVEFPGSGAPRSTWHPALIEGGLPQLLTGAAAAQALHTWKHLGDGC